MSKRSLFWGNASGKLGETVQYRAGGEQRARAYVAKIKNPKTIAQMEQRIPFGNFNAIFRSLRTIITDSFPLRKSNQSGWNAFVQANKDVKKSAVLKEDAALMGCAPYGVIIAKGDVPLDMTLEDTTYAYDPDAPEYSGYALAGFGSLSMRYTGTDNEVVQNAFKTAGGVYEYMTSNNNALALPSRFKVTVVWGNKNAIGSVWGLNAMQMDCYAGSTDGWRVLHSSEGSLAAPTIAPNAITETEGSGGAGNAYDCAGLQIWMNDRFDKRESAFAVIVSWTESGKIRTTSAQMVISVESRLAEANLIKPYQRGGEVWQQVLTEYGYTQTSALATERTYVEEESDLPEE